MAAAPAGGVDWIGALEGEVFARDRVTGVRPLPGGEVNETVLVTCASGDRFVARRAPEVVADWHPSIEGQVAAIDIARRVGVPVPEVVYAAGRVLVYRCVEGAPVPTEVTDAAVARQAGRLHGLLHAVRGDGVGPVQADGASARWPADLVFRDAGAWAERLLARGGDVPIAAADVEAAAHVIASFASGGAASLQHRTSCFVHGDASPGNTLVDAGRIVAIIDFDDAWYGDPAGDMAWWWWNSPSTSAAFDAGCAETNEPADPATLWTHRVRLLLGLANTFGSNAPRMAKIGRLLSIAVAEARRAVA